MTENEKAAKAIKEAVNALVDLLFNTRVKTEEVVSGPEAMERIRKARGDCGSGYALKVDGNGIVGGFGLFSVDPADIDGCTINADRFEVYSSPDAMERIRKARRELDKAKAFDAQANNPVEGSAAELSARIVEAMNLINSEELYNLDSLCAHDRDTLLRLLSAVKRALVG